MENFFVIGSLFLITIFSLVLLSIFSKKYKTILKILSIVYLLIVFFGQILPDGFIWVINGSFYGSTFYERQDLLQTILRWGLSLSCVVFPMATFFNNRLMKNIAIYVCLPFNLMSAIFFYDFIPYFTDPTSRGILALGFLSPEAKKFFLNETFRIIWFGIQMILAMFIPLVLLFIEKHRFKIKDKEERRNFFLSLPFIFIGSMPTCTLQSIFGFSKIDIPDIHFIWVIGIICEIIFAYIFFHKKEYQKRYELCLFLTIQAFMHYNTLFSMGFTIGSLPFQLCNIAIYIYLIALLFKKKHLFYFSYLANVTGAIIAIVKPDVNGKGAFSFWNIHFIYEHTQVFAIPIIIACLGIFARMKKQNLKDFYIGFTIYFVFVWILGTFLNGMETMTGNLNFKVNFFYIFDMHKAFDYIPIIGLINRPITFLQYFTFSPIYQLGVYTLFLIFGTCLFYIIQYFYAIAYDHMELRQVRLKLKKQKKESEKPIPLFQLLTRRFYDKNN